MQGGLDIKMPEELKRCFIALDLPREAINELRKIQKLIWEKTLFTGKLTESENLHLTLKFLGEISDEKIKEVKGKLKEVRFDEFEVEFGKVGVFSKKYIRIIWIELLGKVFNLQKEIDLKLDGLFEPENRFMSHITIARVKNVRDTENKVFSVPKTFNNISKKVFVKKELIEYLKGLKVEKFQFFVNKFYLKESELKSSGLEYRDLDVYNLQNG